MTPSTSCASRLRTAALVGVAALLGIAAPASAITIFTASPVDLTAGEGQALNNVTVAMVTHSNTTLTASNFTATIDWGDGVQSTGTITGSSGTFAVLGSHAYARATIPPAGYAVVVTVHDILDSLNRTSTGTAHVGDGALDAGDPIAAPAPTSFSGVGGTNTSGGALNAMTVFEAAIGGVKNVAARPQPGGFRVITWDGVALDGTDFGGDSVVVASGKTVGIAVDRFQTQGVLFGAVYAVAGDGFVGVNPNAAGLFPAFSPSNTVAAINDRVLDVSFVAPSAAGTPSAPAAVAGFGAVFRNVQISGATSIEYFHGGRSLGRFPVPTGAAGAAAFLGELFPSAVVTRVRIVLGTDALFSFDGSSFIFGPADAPAQGHNLVVADDFAYAEPVPLAATTTPSFTAVAKTPFNGGLFVFSDANPNATAAQYSIQIDWGDGVISPGAAAADVQGGFVVTGAHTYAAGGSYSVTVEVADFAGSSSEFAATAVVAGTPKGIVVTAADKGGKPIVTAFDAATGAKRYDLHAYEDKYKRGVRVALGDVNGDGVPDVFTAPGPGRPGEVKGFDGASGAPLAGALGSFFPAGASYRGGLLVAAGDLNGDGKADVVAMDSGRVVQLVSGADGSTLETFVLTNAEVKRPASIALGDVNGDGVPDLIVGAANAVVVFDGKGPHAPLVAFHPFDATYKGGVNVAAGDLDGTGKADVVVGPGAGLAPEVRVFDHAGVKLRSFTAYAPSFRGGVYVGVVDDGGAVDVLTAPQKAGLDVRRWDGRGLFSRSSITLADPTSGKPYAAFVVGSP